MKDVKNIKFSHVMDMPGWLNFRFVEDVMYGF